MSRYKVEISGINTAQLKVLTNAEMKELFVKLQQGDESALCSAFPIAVKIWMICFRLAASGL